MARIDRLLVFLMVLSIFLDDFIIGKGDSEARQASAFDFYYYYLIFLIFLAVFMVKRKSIPFFPGWFTGSILILYISSAFAGYLSDKLVFAMLKQIIGITFSAISYYNLLKFVNFDIEKIFRLYLRISLFIAIIGLLEEVIRLAGYNHLFSATKITSVGLYRVYSIMGEPYFLAVALIPAVYYYLNTIVGVKALRDFKQIFKASAIGACYILTFSSAGYLGLAIMLILVVYNHGYFNPTSGKFIALLFVLFLFIPSADLEMISMSEVEVRITDSYKAFSSETQLEKSDIAELNSSTFALYSNYLIAQKSFNDNPIIGSGLGTHESTYNQYFESMFGKKFLIMYGMFNAKDGNSLFIRLMSETGLLGILLFLTFMFRFFLGRKLIKDPEINLYVLIVQGIFVLFIIRLTRTGNYISQGFFFFFFLYYYAYRWAKHLEYAKLKAESDSELAKID